LIFFSVGQAKIFTKCQLANELQRLGIPKANVPKCKWSIFQILLVFCGNLCKYNLKQKGLCLVKAESKFDSGVISDKNPNGSYDYGLFQINDKFWCTVGCAGGDCNINCNGKYLFKF